MTFHCCVSHCGSLKLAFRGHCLFYSSYKLTHSLFFPPQYAYFRMGVRQAEMVKAKLFRLSLSELRCRHCFLERRGLYQTPDKKGQTLIANPPLKDVLCVSEETYLTQVAMATVEEFHVFHKLMAREQEEEGREDEYSSDEDEELGEDKYNDDDDDDDDGQHRRKHLWNTGYKKDRK